MYFQHKPAVSLADDAVLAFVCLRNESERLPFFLQYYRDLGVDHFFIIDNQSSDGSAEILHEQPDITSFFSDGSYKGSAAGRLWMEELADHYGVGHWCFTVDVDELFVYPFMESATLDTLLKSLEEELSEGMMCVFLDMYSDKPLSETVYEPGSNFLDTCPFYETATYSLAPAAMPPFLSITGGPRWRSLWDKSKVSSGPMMKKIPLVKWKKGFFYNFSTHSHCPITLSQTTAVLQHFKFFSFFAKLATIEAERGDRRQTRDYQNYANKLTTDNPCFYGPASKRYTDSTDFVKAGIIAVSAQWKSRVKIDADDLSLLLISKSTAQPNENSILNLNDSAMGLGSLAHLWPHINNEAKMEVLEGKVKHLKTVDAEKIIERHASNVQLIDIRNDQLLLKIEPIVWTHNLFRFSVLVMTNGIVLDCLNISKQNCSDNILTKSFDASIYQFNIGEGTTIGSYVKTFARMLPRLDFALMVEPVGNTKDHSEYIGLPKRELPAHKGIKKGYGIFFTHLTASAGDNNNSHPFDGVLESVKDGIARGWVVEKLPSNPFAPFNWNVPVSLYLNNWYIGETTHTYARKDLSYEYIKIADDQNITQNERSGFGFDFPLPVNFFTEKGISDFSLEVRVARRNIVLARSPCRWSGQEARWSHEKQCWEDNNTEFRPTAPALNEA